MKQTDTLIEFHRNVLNEVKNRIVTKGKPTAEILHFVQNDKYPVRHCETPMKTSFQTGENDKQRKHPPTPFKGGIIYESSPFEGGRGMFLLFVIASLRSNPE